MLLRMTDIHKFYNGRQVLSHVSLTVEDHDRIGLVGVNGCGKSTLLRILTGQELPDHLLEGDGEIAKSAKTSIGYLEQMGGVDRESTVWAEMRSVFRPLLDTQERLHQLEEQMQSGDMSAAEEYHRLQTWFEDNDGYQIDVKIRTVLNGMGFGQETYDRVISGFSGGEKTRLAIARLLLEAPNLLILDEPSAALTDTEVDGLVAIMKKLVSEGKSIIFISHKMREVLHISDRITILRAGEVVTTVDAHGVTGQELANMMIGRELQQSQYEKKDVEAGAVISLQNIDYHKESKHAGLNDVSLSIGRGEIVGIAGVDGNGQTQLAQLLTGVLSPDGGEFQRKGQKIAVFSPRASIEDDVALIPEDRNLQGLIGNMSIADNLVLKQTDEPQVSSLHGLHMKM